MSLKIIGPDERLARAGNATIAVFGPSGVGKTHLARSLDPATTLVMDAESGLLALGNWRGDSIDLRKIAGDLGLHPWELCRGIASLLSGPDFSDYEIGPLGRIAGPYSPEMHAQYVKTLGTFADLFGKYRTVFFDSITVASRWSFAWSSSQPESLSDKGKKDTRGTYGLHGQQMIRWLTQLQHANLNIVVVGILDRVEDDMHRVSWQPQIEGGKAGRELPGIFDNVLTLGRFARDADGKMLFDPKEGTERALVCDMMNPWGLPAKDRSGTLGILEPPDLGRLLAKIEAARAAAPTIPSAA